MNPSRRHFLFGLGAAAAASTVPASTAALVESPILYPPRDLSAFDTPLAHGPSALKIGCAAISWNTHDRQAIQDISALGYPGIQLRANVLSEFPDPHPLHDLLASHGLVFVALSSDGGTPLDPRLQQAAISRHVENARYLQLAGGKYLQVMGAFSTQPATPAEYRATGRFLTEVGKRASDFGIQTGFHNHMGSMGQTPEQVAQILDATDPRYVKLELDVAHYFQGGGDPAAAIRTYRDRLLFLHLKDVKPAPTKDGYEFTELGRGKVDFPAIFAALRAIHFRGWGIVELDGERTGAVITPKESAEISKKYLQQQGVWG